MPWPPRSRPRALSSPRSRPPSGRASAFASSADRRASRSNCWSATRNTREEMRRQLIERDHALGHAARHEATDRRAEITAQRPHHGSADAVWFGNHGIFRYVDPFAIKSYAVMAVLGFPIDIANRRPVGVRAARPLAGFEAVKPRFKR